MNKLTGLWKHTSKKGNTYFQGHLGGGIYVTVMENTFKKSDKEPDLNLFIKTVEKVADEGDTAVAKTTTTDEGDLPF